MAKTASKEGKPKREVEVEVPKKPEIGRVVGEPVNDVPHDKPLPEFRSSELRSVTEVEEKEVDEIRQKEAEVKGAAARSD